MPRSAGVREAQRSTSDNKQRILKAAERLFAEKGFRATTVRDVALAARVTHPLIYHYFGSKRGLLAAALDKTHSRMRAVVVGHRDPQEVVADLVHDFITGDRLYALTLTRAFADGMRPADWPGGFPAAEIMLDLLVDQRLVGGGGSSEADARERLGVAVAMAVGWVLLENEVLEVVGLSPEHRDEARERLVRSFVEIVQPVLPPSATR